MKHFKKLDGSIWAFELDGSQDHLISPEMRPLDDAQTEEARRPQREGLVDQTLSEARRLRAPILGVLDGMQASALTLGRVQDALAIEEAKQGLLDITKMPLAGHSSRQEMADAVLARYREIAAKLPTPLHKAFADMLA